MKVNTKRRIRKALSIFRSIGLKNKNISIISNNCRGGVIYDIYGLKYLSPTIGCFMYSEEYIKFSHNLEYYLSLEITPISILESRYKDDLLLRNKKYFIGKIDDVEVVFVHYNSAEEGCKKWNYRRKRVNFDNILIKYNDQNLFVLDDLVEFNKIQYPKIFFTSDVNKVLYDYCYLLKNKVKNDYIVDDIKPSLKNINMKKILNELKYRSKETKYE